MVRDQDNLPPMPSTPQPIDKENFVMNEIFDQVFVGKELCSSEQFQQFNH
jgi:hypothetical protein